MILCIGELLADLIGEDADGIVKFGQYAGGAPFNVGVNAVRAGAQVGFVGRVGHDPIGRFLVETTDKVGFARTDVQLDPVRDTTLAIVSLKDGERDFAFFRHDTADYNIDMDAVDFDAYEALNIVVLGSLMFSEERGREAAREIVRRTHAARKILALDVNFRMDLYSDLEELRKVYKPFVDKADILKFGDDEIVDYTGAKDLNEAIRMMACHDKLLLVTLGARGSKFVYGNISGEIPAEPIKPIDTTGAGDAFFGVTLANLDGKEWTRENIVRAVALGNQAGARATQFKGAVKL